MSEQKTFYLTTPIYYPSDKLHIGHSYTTVAADAMCRYKRAQGFDVRFLTGTDEHGQKIERRAAQACKTPQQFVDDIVVGIKDLWKLMDISYDDFIRTTQPRHTSVVQRIFKQLYDQGDIYKSEYEGLYCTPCESFWTPSQLKDGKCPDCGRDVEKVREESYFLRLSKYAPWLIEYLEAHPGFVEPESRVNEMLNNFLRPGLEDLCVSRTSFTWGIPVCFDSRHVVYVWIDALSNYITALGYGSSDDSLYRKYWPADVHLMAKEIVRFHTIIWPIMLHMLGQPLPKKIYAHGWLTFGGEKMSKSRGNVVDPVILCGRYGVDAIRYYLLREMPFGADGNFTNEALLTRINADLANDLGNLVSRTVAMIEKYFGGAMPEPVSDPRDEELLAQARGLKGKAEAQMEALQFSQVLIEIWALISRCNRYIDQNAPWALAKDEANRARLGTVLYNLAECIRIVGILIAPFLTRTAPRIFAQLGLGADGPVHWADAGEFGLLPAGTKVAKGEALFPRLDIKKELDELDAIREAAARPAQSQPAPEKAPDVKKEQVLIGDFAKLDLRTATVFNCEKVEGSDKLLKVSLKAGEETRTIVSGIQKFYRPEQLVGKTVIFIANLKPVKLKGILSEGMILSAQDGDGNLSVLTTMDPVGGGAEVS